MRKPVWIGGIFGGVPIDWKHTGVCMVWGCTSGRLDYCICYQDQHSEGQK